MAMTAVDFSILVVLFIVLSTTFSTAFWTVEAFSSTVSSSRTKLRTSFVVFPHGIPRESRLLEPRSTQLRLSNTPPETPPSPLEAIRNSLGFQKKQFETARDDGFGTRARNAAINATVGDILVPLCSDLEQRQTLANRGVYAGVEYEICSLQLVASNGTTASVTSLESLDRDTKRGAMATVKPRYPLRTHLERNDWPVSVALLDEVPLWLSRATYEAGTAVGTLAVSVSGLILASLVAFWIRLVGVPTPSMLPALPPGTVVLVTRGLPIKPFQPRVGDVVFFDAPSELEAAVSELTKNNNLQGDGEVGLGDFSGQSPKGKQLIKRVVAVPNEDVGVKQSSPYVKLSDTRFRFDVTGPYAAPEVFAAEAWNRPPQKLKAREFFVAGDNGYRSVDSRVWGPLRQKYLIGTVRWVVWPPARFGPVPPGPISEVTKPPPVAPTTTSE